MSSLTQFEGQVRNGRVQLIAYLTDKVMKGVGEKGTDGYFEYETEEDRELIPGTHNPVLYTFWRRPCDQLGHFTGFRYNGEVHFPDLSIPIRLQRLPRDAERVGDQAALRYWLDDTWEHPYATALKAAVKEANGG